MKKLFLTFLLTGFAASVFAAGSSERNNIRMVTFFPVPYVTYNQLNVKDELLLGAKTSFTGTLGKMSKSEDWSLVLAPKSGTVDASNPPVTLNFNVLALNINSSSSKRLLETQTVLAGSSSNGGNTTLNFSGTLTVNELTMSGAQPQLDVSGTGNVKQMYLFPKIIKGCNAAFGCTNAQINAGTASCSHAKWKTLQLKKEDNTYESKTFLVCE